MESKLSIALLVLFLSTAAQAATTPEDLLATYLNAIEEGDWHTAEACWSPADRKLADRLDIVYANVPLKIDCASPLLLERGRWTTDQVEVQAAIDDAHADLALRFPSEPGSRVAHYDAIRIGQEWVLTLPTTVRSAEWIRVETEFVDLRADDPRRISQAALRRLDDFVRETCDRLGVSSDRVEHLRRRKLGYYLCDEATVEALAGAPTRGVALLPIDAVVTSEPCHLHELAHLLVHYALRETPLYTLPVLQEGAAVALGGRWGRDALAMQGLGRFSLDSGLVTPGQLLPLESFHSLGADWTYAPSGVLVSYLLDELGGERFLDLYRLLSGEYDELARWNEGMIRRRLCEAAGRDWPTLQKELEEYTAALSCGGVTPVGAPRGEPEFQVEAGDFTFSASREGPWWYGSIRGWDGVSRCAVLLTAPDAVAGGRDSRLYAEQLGDRPYAGESWALVLSPGEIGLYDFRTDLLVAKYVEGFCSDRPLVAGPDGSVAFRLPAVLVPGKVSATGWQGS